jgi:hypothetical protein
MRSLNAMLYAGLLIPRRFIDVANKAVRLQNGILANSLGW